MKKAIGLIISIFTIISCSDDAIQPAAPTGFPSGTGNSVKSLSPGDPGTSGTVPVGQLYADIYESYLAQGFGISEASTAVANAESTAQQNPSFVQLSGITGYTPVSVGALTGLLEQANNTSLSVALQQTALSPSARLQILSLFDTLALLKQDNKDYDAVNAYLLSYDQEISENPALSPDDIQTILTATSILNNGFYAESKKRRRDRDWELSVGHIAATVYGADLNSADAITYSLAGKFAIQ